MSILYFDCGMGASGDMLLGALLALQPAPQEALKELNKLHARLRFEAREDASCGLRGMRVQVLADGEDEGEAQEHGHGMTLSNILSYMDALPVAESVRRRSASVYARLADAEAEAHDTTRDSVHFHEVGMLDAVGDIVGCCLLFEKLSPDFVASSPIHVGCGTVRCAHGELPVPAPATANLLRGIPMYGGEISGELCTPTGAALLSEFVQSFCGMPLMRATQIACGLGKKQFSRPNVLRVFFGEQNAADGPNDAGVELSCNLDDMSGEQMGFALERLMETGARDVCFSPVTMKKGRPAYRLICQCAPADADRMARAILQYTSSFGVQRSETKRYILDRRVTKQNTPYGCVRMKTGTGYGVEKSKPEYEDAAGAARLRDLPLADALCDHGGRDL